MNSIEEILQPGRILYINIQFINSVDLDRKRLIFIGLDEDGDPLFVKISSIRTFASAYGIKKVNYPSALAYDSFVNCGQIYSKIISRVDLIEEIKIGNGSWHECICQTDKRQIWLTMKASITVSDFHKSIVERSFCQN